MINKKCKPYFIGIGCRRCGSSWLHKCLEEHPQIGKPSNGLHFFLKEKITNDDICEYESQIGKYEDKNKIVGEYSVSYTYPNTYKNCAERIYKLYPETKLIISVRDPVERAYSDYRRSRVLSEISDKLTFEQAIEKYPDFFTRGLYGRMIETYLKYFPIEHVKILFYQDLQSDPQSYLENLYKYLNVDASFLSPSSVKILGHRYHVKSQKLEKYIILAQELISKTRNIGSGKILDLIKKTGLREQLRRINTKEDIINSNFKKILINRYYEDIKLLEKISQRDLSSWLKM